jgi:hypothetical protein
MGASQANPATGWNSGTSGAAADSLLEALTDDLADEEPQS